MHSRIAALLAPIMLLTACDEAPPVYVGNAWLRLSPNPMSPSAAYFTIETGSAPVVLREVTTPAAVRVEMHDTVTEGGMMKMKPMASVAIPARTKLAFKPGGRHVMLWQVNRQVAATGKVPMTLLFSNGDRILVDARVQMPGANGTEQGKAHHPAH